jgi:TRAP-type mannitol/chloroaromatic compound transport system permease large subunit
MPLFVPAAQALGIDMVWFGVMMAVNLQMAFISPPVGFSLFYLQSVVPREGVDRRHSRSAWPLWGCSWPSSILVAIFPQTVRWLIDLAA